MVEIRLVQTPEEREACYRVRMVVFVEEQGVPPWEEMDSDDETAEHYLVKCDGVIVGTARLVDRGKGIGKIGRVAILENHRGQGMGRVLMEYVTQSGNPRFHTYILDSQVSAIPFYQKLGFREEGELFLDAGIEHRSMRRSRYQEKGGQ